MVVSYSKNRTDEKVGKQTSANCGDTPKYWNIQQDVETI